MKTSNCRALSQKTGLAILLSVFATGAFAQDIILKTDGSEIQAKVLEITATSVKYKNFDFQSGTTRYLKLQDVFMITYENGTKEVFGIQTSSSAAAQENEHDSASSVRL